MRHRGQRERAKGESHRTDQPSSRELTLTKETHLIENLDHRKEAFQRLDLDCKNETDKDRSQRREARATRDGAARAETNRSGLEFW